MLLYGRTKGVKNIFLREQLVHICIHTVRVPFKEGALYWAQRDMYEREKNINFCAICKYIHLTLYREEDIEEKMFC